MMNVSKVFKELGDTVSAEWAGKGRREELFSEIATSALERSRVLQTVDIKDLIRWFTSSHEMPEQETSEFGQPPVIVYAGEGFYIQCLFWLDATTTIHQHDFAGAFGVLSGSSLHTHYHFHRKNVISREMMLGDLEFQSSELLQQGDMHRIDPGDKLVHSLFHLDRPSVSMVIRTPVLTHWAPQYAYMKPYLAIDPAYNPQPFRNQLRMLESVRSIDPDLFWSVASAMVESCDLWMLYKILGIAHARSVRQSHEWRLFLEQCHRFHGEEITSRIVTCLDIFSASLRLMMLRASVHNPVHRFFLALLLNVPSQQAILTAISKRFPNAAPESLIAQWMGEMSGQGQIKVALDTLSKQLLTLAIRHSELDEAKRSLPEGKEDETRSEAELQARWNAIHSIEFLRPVLA